MLIGSGFSLSFGVFQTYYASLPQFANNPNIAVVWKIATGIAYLGAPAVILTMDGFLHYQRQLLWVGYEFLALQNRSIADRVQ
jgi:hypothetical protein